MLALIAAIMLLLVGKTDAAPSVKCHATPPPVSTYVNWRIIDGRKCYYIGKLRLDKSLLYWEPEQPLEIEPMPLPTPAPAIRAQSDFEDRWHGLINRENTLEPFPIERWRIWE
jgi:hypothetical protein